MTILFIICTLTIIDWIGFSKCQNYNPEMYCFKWRHIPFMWIFLFKYEKTYTIKKVKELFFYHKEKYMWYRNIQITRKELNSFIEENI